MITPDPRYAELVKNLDAHRAATEPVTLIRWCRECQEHHAGPNGLCPICADEKRLRS